jgi:hypothetical protein
MSWRRAFEPFGNCHFTENVVFIIQSFGLHCYIDGDDDGDFIDSVSDASGDMIYDRENDDWDEIDNYLPSRLITLLEAVHNWENYVKRGKQKVIVGSMAKLPLP